MVLRQASVRQCGLHGRWTARRTARRRWRCFARLLQGRPRALQRRQHKRWIAWQGGDDLSSLSGKPIRVRFLLSRGDLYAFWVSADRGGASRGYTAMGGPGLDDQRDAGQPVETGARPRAVCDWRLRPRPRRRSVAPASCGARRCRFERVLPRSLRLNTSTAGAIPPSPATDAAALTSSRLLMVRGCSCSTHRTNSIRSQCPGQRAYTSRSWRQTERSSASSRQTISVRLMPSVARQPALVRGVNLSHGGTFGPGRTVIFGARGEGLRFKQPDEPTIRPLTHVDRAHGERDHLWPRWVPALDAVLFTVAYDAPGKNFGSRSRRSNPAHRIERSPMAASRGSSNRTCCSSDAAMASGRPRSTARRRPGSRNSSPRMRHSRTTARRSSTLTDRRSCSPPPERAATRW